MGTYCPPSLMYDEPMNSIILDVRERFEFNAEYIEGSTCIPLSRLNKLGPAFLKENCGKKLTIMCKSGKRAQIAQAQIEKMGFQNEIETEVFKGGILEWKKQGKPTIVRKRSFSSIFSFFRLP